MPYLHEGKTLSSLRSCTVRNVRAEDMDSEILTPVEQLNVFGRNLNTVPISYYSITASTFLMLD